MLYTYLINLQLEGMHSDIAVLVCTSLIVLVVGVVGTSGTELVVGNSNSHVG